MLPHDNAYKNLFSQPELITDFLKGFVHEDWVHELQFEALEKQPASYVSDDLKTREDDLVWRVRMRKYSNQLSDEPEWLYIYIMLEFQRGIDPYMALRMHTYLGLLYQDIIKSQGFKGQKLPAVFPVVIYSGHSPWSAVRNLSDLIEPVPQSLAAYRPNMRYFLLDEGRVPANEFDDTNTVSHLVRLERCTTNQAMQTALLRLGKILKGSENTELYRAFIHRVVAPRFVPPTEVLEFTQLQNLMELHTMIEDRAPTWIETMMQQGLEKGMQQGLQQGIEQGIQVGRHAGQAQSLKRLLTRKFGAVPSTIESKIDAASSQQIEIWFDAGMDASTLEAVFTSH
jgi:predicted transposase/invertase (TIGR01784 family)